MGRVWPSTIAAHTAFYIKSRLGHEIDDIYVLSDGYYIRDQQSPVLIEVWFDKNFQIHRTNGPAWIQSNSLGPMYEEWRIHGDKMIKRGEYLFSMYGTIILKVKDDHD